MKRIDLSVAKNFSRTPGPRYTEEGDFSGQTFRQDVLGRAVKDAVEGNRNIHIDLDGTAGYGTSFLEEAFGGLVRDDGIDGEQILRLMTFTSKEEPYLIEDIQGYIRDAQKSMEASDDAP